MNEKLVGNENNILFYTDEDGNTNVEVILQNEDVWLNTNAIASLFGVQRPAITKHINNIYDENELEKSTCSILEHMGNDGKQKYETKYYNLNMIISIGFRVNSKKAIKFRTWANKIIKDYMVQGFALNDERFMKARKSDQEYFKRLLERIKLIRTSERMFYQKIKTFLQSVQLIMIKTVRLLKTSMQLYKINFILRLLERLPSNLFTIGQIPKKKIWDLQTGKILLMEKF